MENTRIIEINGIKMEVDLRTAKRIDTFRIGDNVRLLVPEYGNKFKVCPGVIVGFDEFTKLPTITIAYLEVGYSSAEIKFAYINGTNEKDEKYEIAPANDIEELHFKKSDVVSIMEKEIENKKEEIRDMERKRDYFNKYFSKYFEPKTETVTD